MMRLPCVAVETGKTPVKGKSINKLSAEFIDQCQECDGTYPAKRIILGESMKKGKKDKKAEKRQRGLRIAEIAMFANVLPTQASSLQ